jgi:hypothetical protein
MRFHAVPTRLAVAALTLAAASSSHAIGVSDAAGDFLPTYTGTQGGDLDVLGAFVTYNTNTDRFVFSGTMDADIGSTPGAFYVFGVNRGSGTARFAGIGATQVLFDAVVIFNQDGSGVVNRLPATGTDTTTLAAGTAQNFGSTLIGQVDGSLLPSTGWAKSAYTWNLWPRLSGVAGAASIADFAPDNSNLVVTSLSPVPEPSTTLMLAAGLVALVLRRRRAE